MYVTLAAVNVLPDWLAILVVFRDVVIVGGVVVLSLLGQPVIIRPLYISKLNTALQIVLVAVSLLLPGFDLAPPPVMDMLIVAVAVTTLSSGAAYVWKTVRRR
jgi:cardiolipin synthase